MNKELESKTISEQEEEEKEEDEDIMSKIFASVNFFWKKKEKILFSTANKNLPSPIIKDLEKLPNLRPQPKRDVFICAHHFKVSIGEQQIRRGDEAKSEMFECATCKKHNIVL